jgi:Fe(3+) dicitrate transport protein
MRDVLNRIPGVTAPENNGTGSHDLAMNFGIRGLNPRLASRSTVLMDGIGAVCPLRPAAAFTGARSLKYGRH